MYTRKPKDMTKFLVGITSAHALHTWQFADKSRQSQIGSSAILSDAARKKREANRKTIGAYHTSKVAVVGTTMRGDVAKFTHNERQKINKRFDKVQPADSRSTPAPPSSTPRPIPDASLYRRPSI